MESLAGRLLVAVPDQSRDVFHRAVVLIVEDDESGSMGVVLNKPLPLDLADVAPEWVDVASDPVVVFEGGPVEVQSAIALGWFPRSSDESEEPLGVHMVSPELGLVHPTLPPALIAAELRGFRAFAGYAGWSPGQLAAELDAHVWVVADCLPGDAFHPVPEELWETVLRRQNDELSLLITYPDDITSN